MKLNLLSSGKLNNKLGKNKNQLYDIYSLNLRPHETLLDNGKKVNTCPFATSCTKICVGDNGHFGMKKGTAFLAQVRRTKAYFDNALDFYNDLFSDIEKANNKAKKKGNILVTRLNAYSDLNHEKQTNRYFKESIYKKFEDVIFYDYTKDIKKALSNDNKNYFISYSYNENTTEKQLKELISKGISVSVVFEKLPATFKGYKVLDGDIDDNRFEDKKNTITGLKFKGSKKKLLGAIASGFCIPAINFDKN